MATTILGQVSINPRGEWVDGEEYKRLDVVNTINASYLAREDNTGSSLDDADVWMQIGRSGRDGHSIVVLSNGNFGNWDEATGTYVDTGIPAAATVDVANAEVSFLESLVRENINSSEKINIIFGKIRKWFSDLRSLAFKDKVDYTTDIENAPAIPTDNTQIANGSNYQNAIQVGDSISDHNTSGVAHNDIRALLKNKVDKDGSKVLSDNNFSDAYKNAVDDNSTQIQALLGAVVYLGNIANTTAELEATGGQALLNNRANEIIAEQNRPVPLQKGDTLVDLNNNDWWHNGSLWVNIGYTAVSIATNATLGVVKGSDDMFKISISPEGVMMVNGIQSVDKSATITAANWVQQSDDTYNAIVYDTNILEESKVSVMPADSESYDMYAEAVVFGGTSSAGQLLLRAKNAPTGVININYSIGI